MQSILDAINEWIKEILIGAINGNLSTMFGDVNEKVGTIANEVGQTPQGWNANIFSMIQTLSENVIVPIAGLVITYVLCYELISMVTEKNNMHDIETFMFFKWIFKAFVAVFIVTNTFNITMAVFDMAQLWGDRIFEKCGIRRDEGGDGGKTLEIRGKRRLSARDGGANYQQS